MELWSCDTLSLLSLKDYGSKSVPESAFNGIKELEEQNYKSQIEILDEIASLFPHPSSGKLITFTHENISAWSKRYKPEVQGILIFNDDILEEYNNRLQRQQEEGFGNE